MMNDRDYSCRIASRGAKWRLMKALGCWSVAIAASIASANAASAETSAWVGEYSRLLGKYATPNGVKYSAWKSNAADMQAIKSVVSGIAAENVGTMNKKDQLAFYVNAYNAWILHEALEKYPTKSVKDALYTFFTSKRIKVAGEQTSFKAFEDGPIRKFGDARVHVALNCASRSCPPLLSEPFRGDKLDAQFEKLSKGFVNSDRGVANARGNTVQLSKIFDWYKEDFTEDGGAIEFINKRRSTPLPKDAKISYQEYDWALNEAK